MRRSPPNIAIRAAPRLACIKPAASVHPEPGSNSPSYFIFFMSQRFILYTNSLRAIFATWLLLHNIINELFSLKTLLFSSLRILRFGSAKVHTFLLLPKLFEKKN